ncbi:aminodeoxychorismate lyase [Evansella sp. AB-P1]|uniref:aminodeoxychorismate lyase n=1 Tax=Evansella sp. AB-P1 TaxID=3037653 RepID=UPI00241F44ED|nr:aminodeoxychorismate lyase [Evansella sp. AB-P1]MDG5790176.1 aminodeoxychorismate lyase [Evansella sp. AB-P1]
MYLYLNGSIVDSSKAAISPFDHGFLYGLGLFETFRTYNGHPFLLDDHFHRLNESAKEMGINLPNYERVEVLKTIEMLLEKNNLKDGYFRWNASAGEREIGLSSKEYMSPTIIVYVKPLPKIIGHEKTGKFLTLQRNTPEGEYRLKSHHFLNNILGKREIGDDPSIEGIFLSEKGMVCEGVVSNIFWWKNDALYTPAISSGALNGITRQFIISLAKKMNIQVYEGLYSPDHLLHANEVFISNSIQEIVPIKKIGECFFKGKQGEFFTKLKEEFDTYAQSLWSRRDLS